MVFREPLEGPSTMVTTRSGQGVDTDAAPAAGAPCLEAKRDIVEFTPEQCRWLQAQSKPLKTATSPRARSFPACDQIGRRPTGANLLWRGSGRRRRRRSVDAITQFVDEHGEGGHSLLGCYVFGQVCGVGCFQR